MTSDANGRGLTAAERPCLQASAARLGQPRPVRIFSIRHHAHFNEAQTQEQARGDKILDAR